MLLSEIPVTDLKGVGPKISELLARIEVHTVQDLLFHCPLRYEDRTSITPIAEGGFQERIQVEGVVQKGTVTYRRKRRLEIQIHDGTGSLTLVFYYFSSVQQNLLSKPGIRLRCYGSIRRANNHQWQMIHPTYSVLGDHPPMLENHYTAIYPTTQGLSNTAIHKLMLQALTLLKRHEITELLPSELCGQLQLISLTEALFFIHRPSKDTPLQILENRQNPAFRRLIFEELLTLHLIMQKFRQQFKRGSAYGMRPVGSLDFQKKLNQRLPFSLTVAQERVIREINADLTQEKPMLRLVQGDVGSGKTIIAAMAIAKVVSAGFQAAIMAPTEILAEQHFQSFLNWLNPMGIRVGWLSGGLSEALHRNISLRIEKGEYDVVVGTHALFQKTVKFKNLALTVIDEQHRFGVHQRLAFVEKGSRQKPHQLIMTATPIPRTLAMTVYADLDISIIDELPPGRKSVMTVVLPNERRVEVIDRIRNICAEGFQAYWVCTLIEQSEHVQCQTAEETADLLKQKLFPLRVGLIHGRLTKEEKDNVMQSFKMNRIHVLVATTVIEVGVDVPNACLMIIENAERLGLSQIHQLRGRIGRGAHESHCVLLYQKPLGENARKRLMILRETSNGFDIAQKDLELRGPGELLGTQQTGLLQLRIADLLRDQSLLPLVQKASTTLVNNPQVVDTLMRRWFRQAERYVGV